MSAKRRPATPLSGRVLLRFAFYTFVSVFILGLLVLGAGGDLGSSDRSRERAQIASFFAALAMAAAGVSIALLVIGLPPQAAWIATLAASTVLTPWLIGRALKRVAKTF